MRQSETAPKINKQNSLAGHPQLQKIIDAVLDGQSCRKIEAWVRPRVSRSTLNRFARETVEASLKRANKLVVAKGVENQAVMSKPETAETVRQLVKESITAAPVLAVREKRLEAIQDRHDRMMSILRERGEEMNHVPGGKSGLLARDFKGDGQEVYKFDAKLAAELREHEKHIAIEMGQWQESAAPNVAIQIVMPTAQASPDASERAPVIDIALPKRR